MKKKINRTQLHGTTRLSDDKCYIDLKTYQSSNIGQKILETPGFKPTQQINQYAHELHDIAHYPKQYRNADKSNIETKLFHSDITQYKQHKQLFARPYYGQYKGPGQPNSDNKNIESLLYQGNRTKISKSNNLAGVTIDRFSYLPVCFFPQKVENIIMNGIVRGGDATRDFVRRNAQIEKNGNYNLH